MSTNDMTRQQGDRRHGRATGRLRPRVAVVVILLLAAFATPRAPGATAGTAFGTSCPAPKAGSVADYGGLTLTGCNFSGQALRGANFAGATLTAVSFVRADLTGAVFTATTFGDSGRGAMPVDFSFATLTNASFAKAIFQGRTYLTYARLSCTDFSGLDLSGRRAVFGPTLDLNDTGCHRQAADGAAMTRTRFAASTLNCEFIPQWNALDLTAATVLGCGDRLRTVGTTGHDFRGGQYTGVVFDGLDLHASRWDGAVLDRASFQGSTLDAATGLGGATGASLKGAKFNGASVQRVDLSLATLYGADFTHANLSNSSFSGAKLQADPNATLKVTASFFGAHLRDVNLAGAQLQRVSFQYASFFGSFGGGTPTFPCETVATPTAASIGYTKNCATARGANLENTDFSNAYLVGTDFGGRTTVVDGTRFDGAMLIGANFLDASFNATTGNPPSFNAAMLQGTLFGTNPAAALAAARLTDAFVDFGAASNTDGFNLIALALSADYTRFNGLVSSTGLCVNAAYPQPTTISPTASLTCPDGSSGVCGVTVANGPLAPTARWESSLTLAANKPVPGYYLADATYDKASTPPAACQATDPRW